MSAVALSALPAVASAAMTWSAPALIDANNTSRTFESLSCPAADECVAVDGEAAVVVFDPTAPGLPLPAVIDPGHQLTSVACPSTTQCTAVEGGGGYEFTFDPTTLDTVYFANVNPTGPFGPYADIACPSTTQCTAVTANGSASTFDPTSPGTPTVGQVAQYANAIACSSTAQCTVLGGGTGQEVTFNPTSPGTTTSATILLGTVAMQPYLTVIACVSIHQCTVGSAYGYETTFDPTSPASATVGTAVDVPNDLNGLACRSATSCVAVDNSTDGQEVAFNPTSASGATVAKIETAEQSNAVSCPAVGECVGVGSQGSEVTFAPSSPGAAQMKLIDRRNAINGVACATATVCDAVDGAGQVFSFNPATPASASLTTGFNYPLNALACLPTQCTTVNDAGGFSTFAPASPSASGPPTGPAPQPLSVECPTTTQCTDVYASGDVTTFDPTASTFGYPGMNIDPNPLLGIACPSKSECVAVDAGGYELTLYPAATALDTADAIDPGNLLLGVSCPWTTQCTAVDDAGQEVTFDPTSPGTPTPVAIDQGYALSAGIACASMVQCTTGDDTGYEFTFDPAAPGGAEESDIDDGNALFSVFCRSASLCVEADNAGDVVAGSGAPVPVEQTSASISGAKQAGQALTAQPGSWTGTPTEYRYQWQRCDASGADCSAIAAASGSTYTPTAPDVGSTIVVVATAINAGGPSAPSGSGPTGVIQAAPATAPGTTSVPSTGTATTPPGVATGGGAEDTTGGAASSGVQPPSVVRVTEAVSSAHHSARFTFTAGGDATGFECALVHIGAGKRPKHAAPRYSTCPKAKVFGGLKPGTYILYVRAVGPGGIEKQPVTRRFRVARSGRSAGPRSSVLRPSLSVARRASAWRFLGQRYRSG